MTRATALVVAAGLLFTLACAPAERAPLGTVTVDTLPNGVVRVQSDGPTRWADTSGWRLERLEPIQPADGAPGELSNPSSLASDGEGRLFVADRSPPLLKVFDATGRLVRTIGREGAGPGEFRDPYVTIRGAEVIVHDPRLRRTSMFDTSGQFRRSWNTTCCFLVAPIGLDDGRIAVPGLVPLDDRSFVGGYIHYDSSGGVTDSVRVPRIDPGPWKGWFVERGGKGNHINMSEAIPYAPSAASTRRSSGDFVFGFPTSYQVAEGPTDADTVRVFGRTWTPVGIPEEQRRAAVEELVQSNVMNFDEAELRKAFRLEDVPTTAAAFQQLLPDPDGNVWVRTPTENDLGSTTFDVFDPHRAYLGKVVVPDRWPLHARYGWGRDRLAVLTEDDAGRPMILRYRLTRR